MRILLMTLLTALSGLLAAGELFAQIRMPYSVDFSAGIPSDWYQAPGSSLNWEWGSHGKGSPGCAVVDMSAQADISTSRIETPPIVFAWIGDPVLRFSAAFIRNNFMAPAVSVWYNTGDDWKILDSWGEWALADMTQTNHQLEGGSDYVPPLDAENIVWHDISVDLSALAGASEIRFAFQAEFPNGGWVLLDNVEFAPAVAGVAYGSAAHQLRAFPNPASTRLTVESEVPFAHAMVVDLLGRTLSTTEAEGTDIRIDIASLPAGPYWLQLVDDEGFVCGRRNFIKR